MHISVIIPVYNTVTFVAEAIESALMQPEIGELLLIDDGSTDGSLDICRRYAGRHAQVRLLQHPGKRNRGVAASRNLGIASAACEYIAFLDADDVYLPGRFQAAHRIMPGNRRVDGVYDAIGTLHTDTNVTAWYRSQSQPEMLTVAEPIPPDQLFETLIRGGQGFFCTDGIVVRSSLFHRTGCFDESLRMGEDTAMWVRMSALGRLVAGTLTKPVGLRRLHATNTIYQSRHDNPYYAVRMAEALLEWGRQHRLPRRRMVLLTDWLFNFQMPKASDTTYFQRKLKEWIFYISFGRQHPLALRSPHYWNVIKASMGLKSLRNRKIVESKNKNHLTHANVVRHIGTEALKRT